MPDSVSSPREEGLKFISEQNLAILAQHKMPNNSKTIENTIMV